MRGVRCELASWSRGIVEESQAHNLPCRRREISPPKRGTMRLACPKTWSSSGSCALPISFRNGRLRIPTGFRPKAQGWEARPTLGTTFKKHFQRRRCCANHRRFGRNPVGIKRNEAARRIANLWARLSSEEGNCPYGQERARVRFLSLDGPEVGFLIFQSDIDYSGA